MIWIICLGSSYFLPYAHSAPLVLHSGISGSVVLSTAYQPPGWSTVPNVLLHFVGRNIGSSRGYLPFPLLFISAVVISSFHIVYISFCLRLVEGNMYMRFMRYEVMRFALGWIGFLSFPALRSFGGSVILFMAGVWTGLGYISLEWTYRYLRALDTVWLEFLLSLILSVVPSELSTECFSCFSGHF